MQEFVPNTYDASDEEITLVRRRPAAVTQLRRTLYCVLSDQLEAGIQEQDLVPEEGVILEDETSRSYYTYDLSRAAVHYAGLVTQSSVASQTKEDDLVFVEDQLEGLGLSASEEAFFQ